MGYVDCHTTNALAQAGPQVTTCDKLSTADEWAVQRGFLERSDLRDRSQLDSVFAQHRVDAVLHFVALANLVAITDVASQPLCRKPAHSSIEEILSTAWGWERKSAMRLGASA